jgi:MFS family permease
MSLYLQYNRGIDPQTTGLILIAQPVVQMIVSPAAGHLSDRIEPRILATAGMACTTAGLGILMLLSPSTPLVVIIAGLAILGFGYGLFSSPNTNAIMSSVEVQHLGLASGMVSTMRAIGHLLTVFHPPALVLTDCVPNVGSDLSDPRPFDNIRNNIRQGKVLAGRDHAEEVGARWGLVTGC